ncbi:MAG: hypothetical protein HKN09_06060 [Saprospiraceae bacterium]|nr:hypothetical protein [Saprospiraceae bacterium]
MKKLILIIFILGATSEAFTQIDAHYWTHQYGAKGLLLNGAVIASADDETSIFYNPACIGQGNDLGFVFSYLTPTYSSLQTRNFTGEGSFFKDDDLGFAPGFAAVRFKPFNTDKIIMGVASFERLSSSIRYDDRVVLPVEDFEDIFYVGDLEFERSLSQEWLGVGISYNVNSEFGIGVTQFSIWHSESARLDFNKEGKPIADPDRVVFGWQNNFSYGISAYGGWLTKIGLIWNKPDFKFGLTFTSPMYGLIHKTANYDLHEQRILAGDLVTTSNNRSLDLNTFKTPPAIGLGFEFNLEDELIVSFSTEYFNGIPEYTIFEDTDDPFDGIPDTPEFETIKLTTSNKAVINFALGFQRIVNEKTTWLWGFRTDFNQKNTLKVNEISEFLSTSPGVIHLSGGVKFKSRQNKISLGLDYGYGRKSGGRQLTDLSEVNIFNFFSFGSERNVTTTQHSIMFFLTYDFLFGNIQEVDEN